MQNSQTDISQASKVVTKILGEYLEILSQDEMRDGLRFRVQQILEDEGFSFVSQHEVEEIIITMIGKGR